MEDIWQLPAPEAAAALLGCQLIRTLDDGRQLRGRIVETEAYDQSDAASHSYKGRTPRTEVMFGPAGHLYVYFTYGMHYCCNVMVGPAGSGAAVLIRALEPLEGIDSMFVNRGAKVGKPIVELTNGPAKLCQAYGIDKAWNGHNLRQLPLVLVAPDQLPDLAEVVQTTRIGIAQATHVPWRFYIKANPYVSRSL